MLNLNDLKFRKNELKEKAEALNNACMAAGRDMTSEELQQFNGCLAEISQVDAKLARFAELDNIRIDEIPAPARIQNPNGVETGVDILASEEYKRGVDRYLRTGDMRMLADLNIGTPADGGYTVPQSYSNQLIELRQKSNVMRQIATVFSTASTLNIPIVTSIGSAGWTLEESDVTNLNGSDDNQFGQKILHAYKATRQDKVSNELLQDSSIDITGFIARTQGTQLGLLEEAAFVNGDGSNKPTGVVRGATFGVATSLHNDIHPDELLGLVYSLPSQYRTPACAFLISTAVALMLRKKRDTTGQYIWQPGLQTGQPDRLLGYPVFVSDFMPSPDNAGNKAVLFGDFSYYYIADRLGITLQRLNELYATKGQVGFLTTERTDGVLVRAEAINYLAMGAAS